MDKFAMHLLSAQEPIFHTFFSAENHCEKFCLKMLGKIGILRKKSFQKSFCLQISE
jgi:hypothetical protein